jgi:hypothetical protein
MKKFIAICLTVGMILAISGTARAALTVSYGTVGSGATANLAVGGVELSTAPGTGTAGSAYVRLNIGGGIALNTISSLSYTSMVTTPGAGGFAPEVVLNIDADSDATLEGTGIGWMQSGWNPTTLGYVGPSDPGDNFLSGDNWPPGVSVPDVSFVTRDAIGAAYNYWSANDTRAGLSPTLWHPFSTIVPGKLPVHDIHGTDLVYSIDVVVGTSGNFDGMKAIIQSIALNGTTYNAPVIPAPGAILLSGIGVGLVGWLRRRRTL